MFCSWFLPQSNIRQLLREPDKMHAFIQGICLCRFFSPCFKINIEENQAKTVSKWCSISNFGKRKCQDCQFGVQQWSSAVILQCRTWLFSLTHTTLKLNLFLILVVSPKNSFNAPIRQWWNFAIRKKHNSKCLHETASVVSAPNQRWCSLMRHHCTAFLG